MLILKLEHHWSNSNKNYEKDSLRERVRTSDHPLDALLDCIIGGYYPPPELLLILNAWYWKYVTDMDPSTLIK